MSRPLRLPRFRRRTARARRRWHRGSWRPVAWRRRQCPRCLRRACPWLPEQCRRREPGRRRDRPRRLEPRLPGRRPALNCRLAGPRRPRLMRLCPGRGRLAGACASRRHRRRPHSGLHRCGRAQPRPGRQPAREAGRPGRAAGTPWLALAAARLRLTCRRLTTLSQARRARRLARPEWRPRHVQPGPARPGARLSRCPGRNAADRPGQSLPRYPDRLT